MPEKLQTQKNLNLLMCLTYRRGLCYVSYRSRRNFRFNEFHKLVTYCSNVFNAVFTENYLVEKTNPCIFFETKCKVILPRVELCCYLNKEC